VRSSSGELQALIEAVVVSETWFFRNAEAFAELTRIVREEWLPHHSQGSLRLLSLPCSSGEEPYSMAMALYDAGFSLDRCHIDAIDISDRALKLAQAALYGKNSFRGTDLRFRDRLLDRTALGYRPVDAVRSPVHFQLGNMLAEDFLPGSQIYDIIFCRNLLIYFAQTTQERAVRVLERLLKPQGVLFVGPSEGNVLLNHGFISRKVPLVFAFSRGGMPKQRALPRPARTRHQPLTGSPHRASPNTAPQPAMSTASASESPLDEAFRLADQGHMADAAESCAEHLRRNGPSATAFFLMGLIRTATGSLEEAERQYRKALYLDRNHHETLVHLHLLLEKRGDTRGARAVRERIVRLEGKSAHVT
jgi:chemotaxis protein methyltransferase WspC